MSAVKTHEDVKRKLKHNEITLGEFEEMTKPLENVIEAIRCKDCKYKNRYFTVCCLLDGLEAINLGSFYSKGVRQ